MDFPFAIPKCEFFNGSRIIQEDKTELQKSMQNYCEEFNSYWTFRSLITELTNRHDNNNFIKTRNANTRSLVGRLVTYPSYPVFFFRIWLNITKIPVSGWQQRKQGIFSFLSFFGRYEIFLKRWKWNGALMAMHGFHLKHVCILV